MPNNLKSLLSCWNIGRRRQSNESIQHPINSLPNEMLVEILSYCEMKTTMLVCRHWKQLVDRNIRVMKKVNVYKITVTEFRDGKYMVRVMKKEKGDFIHLNYRERELIDEYTMLLRMTTPFNMMIDLQTSNGWEMMKRLLPAWWWSDIQKLSIIDRNEVINRENISFFYRMRNLNRLETLSPAFPSEMLYQMLSISYLKMSFLNDKFMDVVINKSNKLSYLVIQNCCGMTYGKLIEFFKKASFAPTFYTKLRAIEGQSYHLINWILELEEEEEIYLKELIKMGRYHTGVNLHRYVHAHFLYKNTEFRIDATFER